MEDIQDSSPAPDTVQRSTGGINIGCNTVTPCTEHLPDKQKLLIRWLHTHARNNEWTWDELCKAVGYSSTTWYRIWTDKYRYSKTDQHANERIPIDEQCASIARYKKLNDQRDNIKRAAFTETSVWKRIDWACRRALIHGKIALIYGESQIGKTVCSLEYLRRNNHGQTTYAVMPPAAGVQFMTREIAEALHVNTSTCFEKLIKDVINALDDSKLLVIDEVHRVFITYQKTSVMRCLTTLQDIHDKSKCGMVLIATNVLRDQLNHGEFAQFLKQLRRRGVIEVQLPSVPPREDLDKMAAHFGLAADAHGSFTWEVKDGAKKKSISYKSEEVMLQTANEHGFGKFVILLQQAAELASAKSEDISWLHFCRAYHVLESMKAA
jgi:DNA transposition AAA+ family ATPase